MGDVADGKWSAALWKAVAPMQCFLEQHLPRWERGLHFSEPMTGLCLRRRGSVQRYRGARVRYAASHHPEVAAGEQ